MTDDFLNNVKDNETEEECKARLQRIREDAKAGRKHYNKPTTTRQDLTEMDSAAGLIYGHSPIIRELATMDWSAIEKMLGIPRFDSYKKPESMGEAMIKYYGASPQMVIMDECHHIDPAMYWTSEYKREPKEKDWERKTFKSGGPTTPSEAVRLKRRAERKAKRKK